MYFPNSKKNGGSAILEHWESSKKPSEKMDEGGEADDSAHKENCKEMAKDILDAIESKSPGVLASALQSFFDACKEQE